MKVDEFDQLVVHPNQTEGDLRNAIDTWLEANPHRGIPLRAKIKLTIGLIVHPFGIHTWTRWRQWDSISLRFLDVGRKCRFCPKGRIE